jgi:hypothetical protein
MNICSGCDERNSQAEFGNPSIHPSLCSFLCPSRFSPLYAWLGLHFILLFCPCLCSLLLSSYSSAPVYALFSCHLTLLPLFILSSPVILLLYPCLCYLLLSSYSSAPVYTFFSCHLTPVPLFMPSSPIPLVVFLLRPYMSFCFCSYINLTLELFFGLSVTVSIFVFLLSLYLSCSLMSLYSSFSLVLICPDYFCFSILLSP